MPQPEPKPEHDLHHDYESDRRGEHKYPDSDKTDAERPSQRERDELKERLDKQSSGGRG